MTQVELARITGIAPDYIRSLENSRRPLKEMQLDKIRFSIGAAWNAKAKAWTVNGLPDEAFSYEWFLRYRTLWDDHPFQVDIETHCLYRRLQALLLGAEPQDYNFVFDRIYRALEGIRSELKIGAARKVFDDTTFEIEHERDQKTGEIKKIRRKFKLPDEKIVEKGLPEGFYADLWANWLRRWAAKDFIRLGGDPADLKQSLLKDPTDA